VPSRVIAGLCRLLVLPDNSRQVLPSPVFNEPVVANPVAGRADRLDDYNRSAVRLSHQIVAHDGPLHPNQRDSRREFSPDPATNALIAMDQDVVRPRWLVDTVHDEVVFRIFDKIGVSNRVELVLYAVNHSEARTAEWVPGIPS
jgi:hypothetical protein